MFIWEISAYSDQILKIQWVTQKDCFWIIGFLNATQRPGKANFVRQLLKEFRLRLVCRPVKLATVLLNRLRLTQPQRPKRVENAVENYGIRSIHSPLN